MKSKRDTADSEALFRTTKAVHPRIPVLGTCTLEKYSLQHSTAQGRIVNVIMCVEWGVCTSGMTKPDDTYS